MLDRRQEAWSRRTAILFCFQSRKDIACSGRRAAGQTREVGFRCTPHPLCVTEEENQGVKFSSINLEES